jgi:hypothetical protein
LSNFASFSWPSRLVGGRNESSCLNMRLMAAAFKFSVTVAAKL